MSRLKDGLINRICDYLNVGSYSNKEINLFRRELRRMSKIGLNMILDLLTNLY